MPTLTVQNIIDATAQDVRQNINSTTSPGQGILVDYCNRIHLAVLRQSRWKFQLSAPNRFITQLQQTDYWFGPSGTGPNGVVDTGLNLSDVQVIKEGSVFDRSNFRNLDKTDEAPLSSNTSFADATLRSDRPRLWRNAPDTPNIMNIYPAPDNQNTYQPEPESPYCSVVAGGSLPARIYYVRVAFVDSAGNLGSASGTTSSQDGTKIFVPANFLMVVHPPVEPFASSASGVKYNQYNVYASKVQGSEVLQNGNTPISTSAVWTEPAGGLVTSAAIYPTVNDLEPVDGYIIEFRYFQQRPQLVSPTTVLTTPDDYKDIIVAGVNWLALEYLRRPEAKTWAEVFQAGITSMIRDRNLGPRGGEYIHPDPASQGGRLPIMETFDPTILRSQ